MNVTKMIPKAIAEEDILNLSSSEDNNRIPFSNFTPDSAIHGDDDDAKLHLISSAPTRCYHQQSKDEHQSDFLDSLQILSISLDDEIELIQKYFPDISISKNNRDILLFEDEPSIPSMSHDAIIIEIVINTDDPLEMISNPVELSIKCSTYYPKEKHACHCRTLCCPFITHSECMVFKNKLNTIAQQLSNDNRNCIIMMLIELEKRLYPLILNNKSIHIQSRESVPMKRSPKRSTGGLGSLSLLNDSRFFDSLKSLHDANSTAHTGEHEEYILPSSFSALQDIQTTKTWDEKKVEDEYAKIDSKELCPSMCGAVWGANGELIFFNNILTKRYRSERKLSLHQERDAMITLRDYNKYLEKCGADGIHCGELHSIRKRVFANHFDEDEDRFTDELVAAFSLYRYHKSNIKLFHSGCKSSKHKYHSYKHAYLHRSLSFLHQQHHQSRCNHHNQSRDNINLQHIPHLVLPQTLHEHKNGKNGGNERRYHRKKRYRSDRCKWSGHGHGHASHHVSAKQGNARIFCGGIIRFVVRFPFCFELIFRHKLSVNSEYNVASLCIYNANECKCLQLNRLSKVLNILSTFLETANNDNMLIPSPYHHNYVAKFVKKAIDDLYLHNEIQAIAIIACLLRQSQFFVLLFFDTNCGYLLQSCVAQYLRIIKNRIANGNINHDHGLQFKDMHQLENFADLLNKQKSGMLALTQTQ